MSGQISESGKSISGIPHCRRNHLAHTLTAYIVAFLKTLILLSLAFGFLIVGLLIPAHLRSVDPAALEAAAGSATSNADQLKASLNAAHVGPASLISEATDSDTEMADIFSRLEERPLTAILGGPAPSLRGIVERLPRSRYEPGRPRPIISVLLPSDGRRQLAEKLEKSTHSHVAALLGIRDLKGMLQLHPADHPAGAPYDAGLLTLAQLIESNHIEPQWAEQIGDLANQAALGNPKAIAAVEEFIVATLSLGKRLDFRSLANLAASTTGLSAWTEMGTLFRAKPKQMAQLYTALHYERESRALFNYLSSHESTGDADLEQALQLGPGAVRHLLEEALPIYQPAPLAERALVPIYSYRPPFFADFAASRRNTALGTKFVIILLAGLAFALALGAAWRGPSRAAREKRLRSTVLTRDLSFSFVFALAAWFLFEPDVLQSDNSEVDSGPRLVFAMASAIETIQTPVRTMQDLNQVTLLVLAFFFVLQLVIYCFCLIKLKEIARQSLPASMKLRLLDNEENLFDFGLYIGLGGTVLSLILVAVGIVEASLMAAYASTLFGILFVALLKVLHLRPYRRKLILESGS